MTEISIADATPPGLNLPSSALAPAPAWRPEDDVNASLLALAERIDGTDPLFDGIANIAATRLLMAGLEFDLIAARRAMAARTTTVTVTVETARTARAPRWMGATP
jgi:hypothetical protein